MAVNPANTERQFFHYPALSKSPPHSWSREMDSQIACLIIRCVFLPMLVAPQSGPDSTDSTLYAIGPAVCAVRLTVSNARVTNGGRWKHRLA